MIFELQQLETYLDGLKKRKGILSNQLHAFSSSGVLSKKLEQELKEELDGYDLKINEKEKQISGLIEQEYKELASNLKSIPGIGNRSATVMILSTNGFQNFDSYKQVISYFGLSPRIFESGTSVRG